MMRKLMKQYRKMKAEYLTEITKTQKEMQNKENKWNSLQEEISKKHDKQINKTINKMKAEHLTEITKTQKKFQKQENQWKIHKEDMDKKHDELINQVSLANEKHVFQKTQDRFNQLFDNFKTIRNRTENDIKSYNKKFREYLNAMRFVYQYHYDQVTGDNDSNNTLNIVLLGQTGYGKSTFGNRLCGDQSKYGNETCFKTSTGVNGCTEKTEKRIVKGLYSKYTLSIIDTAGFFDPGHNDQRYVEDLVETLKGSNGVNAFLVFGAEIRFDAGFQKILRNLTNIFGQEFWRHIIFVRTKVNGLHKENNEVKKWKEEFRKNVVEKFNFIDNTYILPVFALDTWRDYKKQILENFVKLIPKRRFSCEALKSPMQDELLTDFKNIKEQEERELNVAADLEFIYEQLLQSINEINKYDANKSSDYSESVNSQWVQFNIMQSEGHTRLEEKSGNEFEQKNARAVQVIDYQEKDFDESILPLIMESELLEKSYQKCNKVIFVGCAKELRDNNPYSMVSVDMLCSCVRDTCSDLCESQKEYGSFVNVNMQKIRLRISLSNANEIILAALIILVTVIILPLYMYRKNKTPQIHSQQDNIDNDGNDINSSEKKQTDNKEDNTTGCENGVNLSEQKQIDNEEDNKIWSENDKMKDGSKVIDENMDPQIHSQPDNIDNDGNDINSSQKKQIDNKEDNKIGCENGSNLSETKQIDNEEDSKIGSENDKMKGGSKVIDGNDKKLENMCNDEHVDTGKKGDKEQDIVSHEKFDEQPDEKHDTGDEEPEYVGLVKDIRIHDKKGESNTELI
eukprot:45950_1